jgi:hypothetical protein
LWHKCPTPKTTSPDDHLLIFCSSLIKTARYTYFFPPGTLFAFSCPDFGRDVRDAADLQARG